MPTEYFGGAVGDNSLTTEQRQDIATQGRGGNMGYDPTSKNYQKAKDKKEGWGKLRPNKRAKQMLMEDLKKYYRGELGLSEAQKNQIAGAAQTAAAQQAGVQQREIERQSMASGQNQFVGQAAALQRQVGEGAQATGAKARLAADTLSEQLAEARRQEIIARLDQERKYKRQDASMIASYIPTPTEFLQAIGEIIPM